jgi:hypothetical protein
MTIIGISGRCCCVRAITGHAAALPSPAMNSRRRIGHASKPLCGAAYLGQDRMGTGCISPGGQLPARRRIFRPICEWRSDRNTVDGSELRFDHHAKLAAQHKLPGSTSDVTSSLSVA